MAKEKELNLTIKNVSALTDFLKKFQSIDSTALLILSADGGEEKIITKSSTTARSCVKYGALPFEEVFEEENVLKHNINIGVYNLETLIKVLGIIEKRDVTLDIIYDIDSKSKEAYSKILRFINIDSNSKSKRQAKNEFMCAPKMMFANLPTDMEAVFDTDSNYFNFELSTDFFSMFHQQSSIDTDEEFKLCVENNELDFKGKSYVLPFEGEVEVNKDNMTVSIKKEYLKYIDSEIYNVYASGKGLILNSIESDIKIALGASQDSDIEDDLDDEDDDLFDD